MDFFSRSLCQSNRVHLTSLGFCYVPSPYLITKAIGHCSVLNDCRVNMSVWQGFI